MFGTENFVIVTTISLSKFLVPKVIAKLPLSYRLVSMTEPYIDKDGKAKH